MKPNKKVVKTSAKKGATKPIFSAVLRNEIDSVKDFLPEIDFTAKQNEAISETCRSLIRHIRSDKSFTVEKFLHKYNLTKPEGVALMCLAEGLLRIPDIKIAKELVSNKLASKKWSDYIAFNTSSPKLILASFGIYFSGKFADLTIAKNSLVKLLTRFSQPSFIGLVKIAIKYFSTEFVFAETIPQALKLVNKYPDSYFAFDMLGESARTQAQADEYYRQYMDAISKIAAKYPPDENNLNIWQRPNLSVKLTALYPRLELLKQQDIRTYLLPKLVELTCAVKNSQLTIIFDSEEAYRLDIYMEIVSELILHEKFKDYNGIGFVIQSYNTNAIAAINHIIELAKITGKIIPVRLVKGAYWDTEIKHAQERGLEHYPVYTNKDFTDASYIACSKLILKNKQYLYGQFATHNALSAATIIELADDEQSYEFQKLYGMGDSLHEQLTKTRKSRIYAPIGKTKDLLAYLMRRMLENGAITSFAGKVADYNVRLSELDYNIHLRAISKLEAKAKIVLPKDIFPNRRNAMGFELGYKNHFNYISEEIKKHYSVQAIEVSSIIDSAEHNGIRKRAKEYFRPGNEAEIISAQYRADKKLITQAADIAHNYRQNWDEVGFVERANIINKVADSLEENKFEFYALLIEEAGKTINDAVDELAEAVDFCRYYALQARGLAKAKTLPSPTGEINTLSMHPKGVFVCISPWNFPLAIFTGQIVAALVAGNTVIAKPASETAAIAAKMVKLMHEAGVDAKALHLLVCSGADLSQHLLASNKVHGVAFTGSTGTATNINQTLASRGAAIAPLIAETGGQNAMIVDSSALLEQVVDDVLSSAFLSAGQRCSALRVLYVQEEIYDQLLDMIIQATDLLSIGDTKDFTNDIGPVISNSARGDLQNHIKNMIAKGFKLHRHHQAESMPKGGNYLAPHIFEVNSINDIENENFGPILHVVKYPSKDIDRVIDEINDYGFGLTFGIHSRIDSKIEYLRRKIQVGNIYANRSMVGAKVESQPFGGEKLSGTGFKAGGPNYLLRFLVERTCSINTTAIGGNVELLAAE